MKIVVPSSTNAITVIPRTYGATYDLVIYNKSTRASTTLSSHPYTTNSSGEKITFSITDVQYSFDEDTQYRLEVVDITGGQVYRDLLYATSQTIDQVNNDNISVNNGEYTPVSQSDNEFIYV